MRLFILLAVFGFASCGRQNSLTVSAPGDFEGVPGSQVGPRTPPASPSTGAAPEEGDNSLAEALRTLNRRKREVSGSHRPYSAYSPLGTHRYRYPLYRKRSVYLPQEALTEEDPYLNAMEAAYEDYLDEAERPSLFRERERGPVQRLISNGHFSSTPVKKGSAFSLENSPYDLGVMGRLYNQGKRDPRERVRTLVPSNRLFVTLNEMNSKMNRNPPEQENYSSVLMKHNPQSSSMIRQKRASNLAGQVAMISNSSSGNQSRFSHPAGPAGPSGSVGLVSSVGPKGTKSTDRQKRAYEDGRMYFDPKQEEANDFLTREYFKTIARSVGNKKKRMAFAKFEAQKRSNTIDSFLENPKMLKFLQKQIRDAEEEVAKDAAEEIGSDPQSDSDDSFATQVLLTNSISRLAALERMREALFQLERIQDQDAIQKRAQGLVGPSESEEEDREKAKRRKALKSRLSSGQKEEEEEEEEKEEEGGDEKRNRADRALRTIFKRNRRDECPVLERIVMNCIGVTEMVRDHKMAFLEPCLRHEVCYMCGSGLEVTRHECDAILSSALEAGCNEAFDIPNPSNGSLDCLSSAGDTFDLLGDPSRYDDKGTCTFDPCVRQLLDSR